MAELTAFGSAESGNAKKKKKSTHLEIFSLLNAKPLTAAATSVVQPKLHANAARWNETLVPKNFVMKKKKRKGLSTFKKKILMERLRAHVKKALDAPKDLVAVVGCNTSLRVYNFVDDVDTQDEDELQEVCNDLLDLVSAAGGIYRLRIIADGGQSSSPYVEVLFHSEQCAVRAAGAINGVVCAGKTIVAQVAVEAQAVSTTVPPSSVGPSAIEESASTLDEPGRVSLFDWVSMAEVTDAEEAQEALNDAHELCSSFGRISRVWLERRQSISMHTTSSAVAAEGRDGTTGLPWMAVLFSNLAAALACVQAWEGKIVGGTAVSACVYDRASYEQGMLADAGRVAQSSGIEWCVRFVSFAADEEVADSDERVELMSNLAVLLQSLESTIAPDALCFVSSLSVEGSNDVLLSVASLQDAAVLQRRLGALVVGGEPLQVDVVQLPSGAAALLRPTGQAADAVGTYPDGWIQVCDVMGTSVVMVQSFLSEEDLEDSEGLPEMKRDLLSLASGVGVDIVRDVLRVQVVGTNNPHRGGEDGNRLDIQADDEDQVVAVVEFASAALALEAALYLDERVVAGAPLRVILNEPLAVTSASVASGAELLISRDYNSSSLRGADSAPRAASTGDGTCLYSMDVDVPAVLETVADSSATHNHLSPAPVPVDGGSKYTQARALPRLEAHHQPNLPIPVADEGTNAAARELLRLISTFQARMKEKNPQKSKQKLRFVAGLKQCTNAVKAGKVRVLLLAPNTEANEVVDEKIDALIQEARRRDVPVCYCLSKRLLGKAVQLSMKQSAIAVLDPDGAYEFFKKIIKFVNPNPTLANAKA